MVQLFGAVRFGRVSLRYATGIIEIVSAVLLLVPRLAAIGAALLAMTMIGALIAHATVLPFSPIKAIILLVMVSTIFWVAAGSRQGPHHLTSRRSITPFDPIELGEIANPTYRGADYTLPGDLQNQTV